MSRLLRAAAVLAAATLGVTACSGDDVNPLPNPDTSAPNTGATCDDRKGDISGSASSLGGNLSEPAGIDLVHAEARLTADTLKVSFLTAGPIKGTPEPELVLSQGLPNDESSFELYARPGADPNGPWLLEMVTFKRNAQGGISQSPTRTVLPPQVAVEGATLSYEVSQKDIPRVASYVWQFGASSTSGQTVLIDNCYLGEADGSTAGSTPEATTTLPPGPVEGKVGDALTYRSGAVVTVFSVESPPRGPQAGATPPDPAPNDRPEDVFKLVTFEAQVCAPEGQTAQSAASYFFVKDSENRNLPAKTVAVPAHVPAMPATFVVQPGVCQRAWVTSQILANAQPASIIYSPDPQGVGALLWKVA